MNANDIDGAVRMLAGSAKSMGLNVVEADPMAKNKRLTAARAAVDTDKQYDLGAAVALVKGNAKAKFDETIEISLNLGIDRVTPTRWSVV